MFTIPLDISPNLDFATTLEDNPESSSLDKLEIEQKKYSELSLDHTAIPFGKSFPSDLNDLIISYLPPADLESWSREETSEEAYNLKHVIQVYASEAKVKGWESIFTQLIASMPVVNVPRRRNKKNYDMVCNREEITLQTIIRSSSDSTPERIRDAVFFYAQYNIQKLNSFLIELICDDTLVSVKKSVAIYHIIQAVDDIQASGHMSWDKENEGAHFCFPWPNIITGWCCYLVGDVSSCFCCKEWQNFKSISLTPLLVAALHGDLDQVHMLTEKTHDAVGDTLVSLDEMLKHDDERFHHGKKKYTHSDISFAKLKLIKDQDLSIRLNKRERDKILARWNSIISKSKTVEQCLMQCSDMIDSRLFHYSQKEFTFFKRKNFYSSAKIKLIELVQEKITSLLNKMEKIPNEYQKENNFIISHPIFSQEHEGKGVNPKYRKQLQKIILEKIISTLKLKAASANTLDRCCQIYEDIGKIKLNYLWPVMNAIYPQLQKEFIEMIQEKIVYLLKNSKIRTSQHLKLYKSMHAHPVFSDDHYQHGVTMRYKNELSQKMYELEDYCNGGSEQEMQVPIITFEQFKAAYRSDCQKSFIKPFWSPMYRGLKEAASTPITTMRQVEAYAAEDPHRRTSRVLRGLMR